MSDDPAHVVDLLDRLEWLSRAADEDEERFYEDHWFREGVIRDFEVLGEAAKRVSPALRDQNPGVPWADMAGLRAVLIHQYGRVDPATVWRALQDEVPRIRRAVEALAVAKGWL